MTAEEMSRAAVAGDSPPEDFSPALKALWLDAAGDWSAAHHAAQEGDSGDGAWVHAYLHRKEGDASNARHWYDRAGKPPAEGPLDEEWTRIAETLLAENKN